MYVEYAYKFDNAGTRNDLKNLTRLPTDFLVYIPNFAVCGWRIFRVKII